VRYLELLQWCVSILTDFVYRDYGVLNMTHVMKFATCVHRTTGLRSCMLLDTAEKNASFLQKLLLQHSEVNNFCV